jgi:uncharacterized protein YcfL
MFIGENHLSLFYTWRVSMKKLLTSLAISALMVSSVSFADDMTTTDTSVQATETQPAADVSNEQKPAVEQKTETKKVVKSKKMKKKHHKKAPAPAAE